MKKEERPVTKVLIIEDDLMMADMLEEVLRDEGFDICGIAQSPQQALMLADQHVPELAIVDVLLLDGLGTDLAAQLIERYDCGILYTTGNIEAVRGAAGHACLPKPFRLRDAALGLNVVAKLKQSGQANPPMPDNLYIITPTRAAAAEE